MNGYSLEDHWATRKLTVVVGGYGSEEALSLARVGNFHNLFIPLNARSGKLKAERQQ